MPRLIPNKEFENDAPAYTQQISAYTCDFAVYFTLGGVVRQSLVAIFMLVVSVPAVATADLPCKGREFFLYMSVGSDNTVDSAILTDESTKASITYRLIENKQLIWKDDEGDFSANRLRLILRGDDGTSSIVEAKGRNGVLHHQQRTYKLDCDWGER